MFIVVVFADVFVIDLCLVIVNVLAIIVSVIYQDYVKLYACLPQTFPDLPSFGPEVSHFYKLQTPDSRVSFLFSLAQTSNYIHHFFVSRTCQLAQLSMPERLTLDRLKWRRSWLSVWGNLSMR